MTDYHERPWRDDRGAKFARKYGYDSDRDMSGGFSKANYHNVDERQQGLEHYNKSQNRSDYGIGLRDYPWRSYDREDGRNELSFFRYMPDDAFGGRYGRDNPNNYVEAHNLRRRHYYNRGDYGDCGQSTLQSEADYPPYTTRIDRDYLDNEQFAVKRDERGFMERAGDEFRSWFGDRDALRRREQDHRGRGPRAYVRSDARILEDVYDTLTDDSWIDASDIDVSVSDGEVTLAGTVGDRSSKRRAEDVTEDISGVKHVQNNLRYGSQAISSTNDPSP